MRGLGEYCLHRISMMWASRIPVNGPDYTAAGPQQLLDGWAFLPHNIGLRAERRTGPEHIGENPCSSMLRTR
jgi:hypothetical protein